MLLLVLSAAFIHEMMSLIRLHGTQCMSVYQALNGLTPSYSADMLQPVTTLERLRSANTTTFHHTQPSQTRRARALSTCSSRVWSSLPPDEKTTDTVDI